MLEEARDKNGINVGNENKRKRPENANISKAVGYKKNHAKLKGKDVWRPADC